MKPEQLRNGDTIVYKLLPEHRPIDPDRLYHTIVLENKGVLFVKLTDPDFNGMVEYVEYRQVVNNE